MESRAGTGHGRGDESVWYGGSSPESEVEVFIILRDLDLGLNVSISTILGLSSHALTEVSKDVDILLLWNSLLVSSNLSCKNRAKQNSSQQNHKTGDHK